MLPLWGPWGILSTTAPLPLKPYLSQMRIVRDKVKCPCMGRNFFVNSPMMTPKAPGWGVVGHDIDRHIKRLPGRLWSYSSGDFKQQGTSAYNLNVLSVNCEQDWKV